MPSARYLLAYQHIGWTPDNFGYSPDTNGSQATAVAQQFIGQWGTRDPDNLVAGAREAMARATARAQVVTWAYYRERASSADVTNSLRQWKGVATAEQVAEAERIAAQRLRQEYDRDFAAIGGEQSAARFVSTYASSDPDLRLPVARQPGLHRPLEQRPARRHRQPVPEGREPLGGAVHG